MQRKSLWSQYILRSAPQNGIASYAYEHYLLLHYSQPVSLSPLPVIWDWYVVSSRTWISHHLCHMLTHFIFHMVSNRTIYYYTIVPPSCYMLQIDYRITSLSKYFIGWTAEYNGSYAPALYNDSLHKTCMLCRIVYTKLNYTCSLLSQCSTCINWI